MSARCHGTEQSCRCNNLPARCGRGRGQSTCRSERLRRSQCESRREVLRTRILTTRWSANGTGRIHGVVLHPWTLSAILRADGRIIDVAVDPQARECAKRKSFSDVNLLPTDSRKLLVYVRGAWPSTEREDSLLLSERQVGCSLFFVLV